MAMLQSANGLPDHGSGELGKVAHGALLDSRTEPSVSALYLGYNTLPEPPYPLVGYLRHELDPRAAAGDPATLLRAAAESMRAEPVPPASTFDDAQRRMATLLRVDAIVMIVPARLLVPAASAAARAVWENLIEGYYRDGDAEACAESRETLAALGVDREKGNVLLVSERDSDGEFGAGVRVEGEGRGDLFDLLREVLDAQYSWTNAAFGLAPNPRDL